MPPAPVPRTADGHPDLSGVWWAGNDVPLRPLRGSRLSQPLRLVRRRPRRGASAPAAAILSRLYQPWAKEKAKTLSDKDDPSLRCTTVAFGTANVSLYALGFVGQIVQTPKFVVMLTETYHSFKIIPDRWPAAS